MVHILFSLRIALGVTIYMLIRRLWVLSFEHMSASPIDGLRFTFILISVSEKCGSTRIVRDPLSSLLFHNLESTFSISQHKCFVASWDIRVKVPSSVG